MKPIVAMFDVRQADIDYFKKHLSAEFELIFVSEGVTADTIKQAAAAEVISMHVSSPVTADIMKQLPRLRHVACRSTGYDNVDLEYAHLHQITVSTVPSYGDETVAEYAALLLLAVSRKLLAAVQSVQSGQTKPDELTGRDLSAKTLGIIGTGRIGRRSAAIARGFGMNVLAYDPFPNEAAARDLGFQYVPLAELLAKADAITLHAPATKDTEHLINSETLASMRDGVIIINTARGSLIDTPALIDALESGKVAGAGLDVLEGEEFLDLQPELDLFHSRELDAKARQVMAINVLSKMPNVLLTHHNAYNSAEALDRIRHTSRDNVRAWHAGNPQNLVK